MYTDVWFSKPAHGDMELLFMAGLPAMMAEELVEALSAEFPDCTFWTE